MVRDVPTMFKRQFSTEVTRPQVVFDVVLGAVLPVVCLILDPFVFRQHGVLYEHQLFAYSGIAVAVATLLVWLGLGRRLSRSAQQVVAAILLVAGIVAVVIGVAILPLSIFGLLVHPISVLGFTPLLTAFVFIRNSIRCFTVAGRDPVRTWPVLIVLGVLVALGVPLVVQWSTIAIVSSVVTDLARQPFAAADVSISRLQFVRWCPTVCAQLIEDAYRATGGPARRENLARAYQVLTGKPVATSGSYVGAEPTESAVPKPDAVYLDIAYHGIGWSPDRGRYYFVKVLTEQRDHVWGVMDSGGPTWVPLTTDTRYVLSSVARDGSGWKEHFDFPVGNRLASPDASTIDHSGNLIVGLGREVWRFTAGREVLLGEVPFDINELVLSPSGESLAVGNGYGRGGIALMSIADGRSRVITNGYDEEPRWSPDSRRIVFGRYLPPDPDNGEQAIVVFDLDRDREEVVLQGKCMCGSPSAEWTDDRTIAVGAAERERMAQQSDRFQVETAPPPVYLGPAYEKSRCVDRSRGVWTAEEPWDRHGALHTTRGADGYVAGYRPASVQVLRVGDGVDAATGEPPCEVLFNAFRHRITVTNNGAWEHELGELRDARGAIW